MEEKKIMAMPMNFFWIVVFVCALGIIIGSIWDFNINVALANKTDIGAFFATYGSYFSYCLYPAAGACFFVGLKKKDYGGAQDLILVCGNCLYSRDYYWIIL